MDHAMILASSRLRKPTDGPSPASEIDAFYETHGRVPFVRRFAAAFGRFLGRRRARVAHDAGPAYRYGLVRQPR